MNADEWIGLATVFVACASICAYIAGRTPYGVITIGTFTLHLTVAGILYNFFGLISPDATLYNDAATLVATGHDLSSGNVGVGVGKEGFILLLGGAYALFGVNPMVGLVINSLACAIMVPLVADIARRLGAPPQRAALLVALFPPFIVWGTLLLREAIVWLLLVLFSWALVRLSERVAWPALTTGVAALIGLLWVRGALVALLAAAGLLGFAWVRRGRGLIPLFLAFGVAYALLARQVTSVGSGYDLERINDSRAALSREGASGFTTVDLSTPVEALRALPEMMARVTLGPFPWEWPALGISAAVSTLCWLALLGWAWRARKRIGVRRRLIWTPVLGLMLALALTSGNYGTMDRLRVQASVLLVPLAAAGMGRRRTAAPEDGAEDGRQHALARLPPQRSDYWSENSSSRHR